MNQKKAYKSHKSGDNSSLEKDLIYELFKAKIKRLDARISSEKYEEKREYKEALFHLLSALNTLLNQEEDNNKKWLILIITYHPDSASPPHLYNIGLEF